MMKKALFMLAMLTCIFASCSDGGSDEPSNPTPKPEEVKSEITLDNGIVTNGLSFGVAQGEQSVSFTTNTNWTLSIAATTGGSTWCKASATSGSKGTANVKFTVTENTDYDDRSVSVTIKAGTASKTFTITQKGADALLVTTKKYEVAQAGGKIEVEVKANIEYQLAVSETAKDWIKETQSKSRALTTKKHTFQIAENEEVEKREGEITIKSGDKVETVKVYQAGGAVLLLSKNEFTISDAGETITVDIKSNVEYGVQMPDVDWIKDEASNRGMSSHTLKYVIEPNEGYDSRSAEIIFYDLNSDLKDTLKVIQAQKDAIVISKKEYDVEADGETIEVKLSANVDFEVTMPEVDWVEQVESRALTEHTLYFKVMKNEVKEERMVEIEFTNTDSRLSEKIKITQQGIRFLQLTKDEYTVSDAGETIEVEIKSNVEYGIQMPEVDWITKDVSERSVSEETLKFIVDANETYDNRSTKIVFYDKNGDLKDTLTVIQVQKDAIILAQYEYTVESRTNQLDFTINANVDYKVEISVDWIKQISEGRALKEEKLHFSIEENTLNEAREGAITISSGNISQTIKVKQKGKFYLILNEKESEVMEGKTIELSYSTNFTGSILWKSLDTNILTVSNEGIVTGINKGETTVIISSEDGALSDSCKVSVKTITDYISFSSGVSSIQIGSYITKSISSTIKNGSKYDIELVSFAIYKSETGELYTQTTDSSLLGILKAGESKSLGINNLTENFEPQYVWEYIFEGARYRNNEKVAGSGTDSTGATGSDMPWQ